MERRKEKWRNEEEREKRKIKGEKEGEREVSTKLNYHMAIWYQPGTLA